MTKKIFARKARQDFFEILRQAAAGGRFVITHRGQAVARLVPAAKPPSAPNQDPALDRLLQLLDVPLGGHRFVRDEAYDR
jgi:prevent-host-death family protein